MLKANVVTTKGRKVKALSLPKEFSQKENLKLLAQAIRVYEERQHTGLAKAKTRAEVARTKKKWYSQKGTGGARHGARSAPIFVGGGVAHGPRPLRRELTLPQRIAKKALSVALSLKAKEAKVTVVRGLASLKKTKEANDLLKKLGKDKRFTFVLVNGKSAVNAALRNLKRVDVVSWRDLNAYQVYFGGNLIFDEDIFMVKKKGARK